MCEANEMKTNIQTNLKINNTVINTVINIVKKTVRKTVKKKTNILNLNNYLLVGLSNTRGQALSKIGVFALLAFFLIAGYFAFFAPLNSINNNANSQVNGGSTIAGNSGNSEVQIADLSFKNYNYFPNTLTFKYGIPAQIRMDMNKISGCYSTIVAPELGIRKFTRTGDNIISFTPNKRGTFKFSCIMGMGSGKIVVV